MRTAAVPSWSADRLGRATAYAFAALFIGLFAWQYLSAPPGSVAHLAALDYTNYANATRTWMAGGSWYLERQLHGPYVMTPGDVLYPPTWLWLFVPAAVLPAILWWVVPIGTTLWVIANLRPSPLGWATMAALLAWPQTAVDLLTGNPGIWLVAAVALATMYRWPTAFLLTKITVAPLALFGIRDRRWWYAAAGIAVASLPFAAMFPTYVQVLRDAQTPAGPLYSVFQLPMLCIPLIAWATRRSDRVAERARDGRRRPAAGSWRRIRHQHLDDLA